MRVFLDVGAHRGETLCKVTIGAFDKIHAFEPSSWCWPDLQREAARLGAWVYPYGWLDEECQRSLVWSGTTGATLYSDKVIRPDYPAPCEFCSFVKASEWLAKNTESTDKVFLKLNCEGAEIPILKDIAVSGGFTNIAAIALSWDCLKIPSLKGEREALLSAHPELFEGRMVDDDWDSLNPAELFERWSKL